MQIKKQNSFSINATMSLEFKRLWLSFCRCDSLDCDDILQDVEDNADSNSVITKYVESGHTIATAKLRCFPVYLGGSDCISGCSTIGAPRLDELYST
jgi:hypothetical protein